MCPGFTIVAYVFDQDSAQVLLAWDNDVVEAVSADGADYALAKWILPGRAVRCNDFFDSHALHTPVERRTVDAVTVVEQEPRLGASLLAFPEQIPNLSS